MRLQAPGGFEAPGAVGAARQAAPEYGPPKGTLLIVGGNMAPTSPLYAKFIQLAGGPDAKFVIVPLGSTFRTRL